MLDIALIAFIILYFGIVAGSMVIMMLAWYSDYKISKKRANIKIVRNEKD